MPVPALGAIHGHSQTRRLCLFFAQISEIPCSSKKKLDFIPYLYVF
jgi:hypothetical protein